jgi:formylmethanofuran dehydrogenase subunit B
MGLPVRLRGPFCGLPCGEMTIKSGERGTLLATGGCPVCREAVAGAGGPPGDAPSDAPRVEGKEVPLDRAIQGAARILLAARAPVVYGLSRSADGAALRACELAAALGGALDIEGSGDLQPDLTCLQQLGLPSATFGEIRNRADLLLLWRCDPRATHPSIFGRPAGTPLESPGGRAVIVAPAIDAGPPVQADLVLDVGAQGDLAVLLSLRAVLHDRQPAGEKIGGVTRDRLRDAAARLRKAHYTAIIWDSRATRGSGGTAVAAALTLLARDLNRVTRCAARPLGAGGNVAGALATLAATTGVPRAIDFASGRPRFAAGERDVAALVAGGAADVILLIGARALPGSRAGVKAIVVGPRVPEGITGPEVFIPTAVPGLSAAGNGRRADGVPVRLRAVIPSRHPLEEDVLAALAGAIRSGRTT